MPHQTVLIADLHLDPSQPNTTTLFEQFFNSPVAQNANTLYILGDLFEAWIGDDDLNHFTRHIQQLLKRFTEQGKTLYIMHGNRDFMLGERFANAVGGTLIADPTLVSHNGQTILLTHGDVLCTNDHTHQRYRRWIQHPITKKGLAMLPLMLRRKLATTLRQQSRRHFEQNNARMEDVNETSVEKAFAQYQADRIIHGHTHLPGQHHYPNEKSRDVLGSWHHGGYAFTLETNEVTTWTLHSEPKG